MKVLILDIDLTLNEEDPKVILKVADKLGYGPYSKDVWNLFEESARDLNVKPHPIPAKHYNLFSEYYDKIIIISSRINSWRKPSEMWLAKQGFTYDHLFLRESGDYKTSSATVKRNIIKNKVNKLYPGAEITAVDDDAGVVEAYRKMGIGVFVAPHGWSDFLRALKIRIELRSIEEAQHFGYKKAKVKKLKRSKRAIHKTRRQKSVRRRS